MQVSASFTITRTTAISTDGTGVEIEEIDLDGTVSGQVYPVEPDVGLSHPYIAEVDFIDATGRSWLLTYQEIDRAEGRLYAQLD